MCLEAALHHGRSPCSEKPGYHSQVLPWECGGYDSAYQC